MQHVDGAGLIATSSRTAAPAALYRPMDCAAALAALAAHEHAIPVAGGTDLCAQYNEGLQPDALVALDRIPDLREISVTADALTIGAAVTHAFGCEHPAIAARLPGFADAWRRIANVRVRFWATIGGNIMAQRTRYEMSLLLTALDARLHFLGADGAFVTLAPRDVWSGLTPKRALLHHIVIPLRGATRFDYDRSLRPVMTLAICRDEAGGRAVLATEWLQPSALSLPAGLDAADTAAAAFADLPTDVADPVSSNWYLRRAGEVMLRRTLQTTSFHA